MVISCAAYGCTNKWTKGCSFLSTFHRALCTNCVSYPSVCLQTVLILIRLELDIYCTIEMSVSTPISTPIVGVSMAPQYVEDIQDSRFRVFILKHAMSNSDTPFSYVLSEAVTPNSSVREVVGFILGDIQQFKIAKMQYQSYVTCRDHVGLESRPKFLDVHALPVSPKNISLKNKIAIIRNLSLTGDDDAALTELLYVSRIIALSERPKHTHKMQLMAIMNDITAVMDRSANDLIVSAQMNKVLNTINRLMLISNLTDPPFNVSIDPWKLPILPTRRGSARKWINMYVAASQTLHSVTTYYYYHLLQRVTKPNDRSILELMFDALLKVQLSRSWQGFVLGILQVSPVQEFEKRTQVPHHVIRNEAAFISEFMQKAIVLLMKSIDFHINGHEGHLNFSRGTTTASGSVLPAHSATKWSGATFNDYQDVRISVNVNDETLRENDPIYLGVFVEIPVVGEITPRVHVFLLTHLTQRNVEGTIDVQMHTTHTRKKCDVAHCTTTDVARSSETGSVAIFKLELNEPDLAFNNRLVRQLRIHMTSQDGVRAVIRAGLPRLSEVARAPSKRDMDLINIVDYGDVFMGVLPGNGIHPGVPIPLTIDTVQFMCIQKSYDDPTSADNLDSKSICQMVPSAREDGNRTTCRCSGSGVVNTYELGMMVKKILVGDENGKVQRASTLEYGKFNFLMLLFPALFLLVVVFAVWRDKVTWKREFIQELADTFPDDRVAYIVCVLTGKRLLAGTRAHVAIQIFGMSASSRVHILSSKSYKVLGWGQDDWFLVFTPANLGKLSHVSLWQDYSALCSSWYCSRVVVHDVKHQTWYEFNVEKWSTISADSDESRIIVASGRKYNPEKLSVERFKFKQHYWREIKNTHSLISPLFKQRRFLHSYCMRACLTLTFVLTLVSLVIVIDHYVLQMGVPLNYDNIIAIAVFATIIASIPYTIASFFFTRSLVKMKKTKTLDLGLADQMRNRWLEEADPTGRELTAYSIHDLHRISAFNLANKHERETTREKSVSRKSVRSKKGKRFPNPIFALQMHKWMASSIYRPIRIEDYGIKRLVVCFHVCGWVLVSFTILGNIIFLIFWLAKLGWLEGRNGILIVSVAIAFELVRSSLIVLLLSCYTVYHQKRCNFEINCLDLSGLRNNARIVDRRKFIIAATKSYYHPLKTDEVQAMYQKKVKKMSYVKMFSFFLLFLGMVLPTLIVAWKKDTKSIFRVKRSTADVYREPVWNNYTLDKKRLKNIHSMDDLSDYLLGTLMPATMVYKWYNSKLMRPADLYLEENKKKKYWFVDRSSRLHGASTARFLRATNASKLYIARQFRGLDLPIFSEAYGQYDANDEYKTTYNRWRLMMKQRKSERILDSILSRGVTGVTGIFYPASVGKEIVLRRDVEHIEEGVRLAMKRLVSKYTRAIIVEISIIHPLFSQEAFNPMFGVTILEILLENCASGLYTGSIRSSFFFAKTSINYLRFAIIYSLLMTACIMGIGIYLSNHGFRACTKSLLVWTLFFGSISCFVAVLTNLGIHSYVDFQEMASKSEGDAHVDYHNIVWLKELTYASSGCFCLLGAMAWAIWSAELTGMSKARFEDNFARLLSSYSIFLFFKYCIGMLLSWGTHESALNFERISKTTRCSSFTEPSCALFIAVSNLILWTLQIGVTMGIIESFLSCARNTGGPSNSLAYPKRFHKLQKKILFRESLEYERSRSQILAQQPPRQEMDTSNERLKIKFSFLK